MRYGKTLLSLFILSVTFSFLLLTVHPTTSLALKVSSGSFSARDARADVRAAHRAYVRAASRYREAQRVLRETRSAESHYGAQVARWVRLARRAGWRWGQIPMLMYVIHRESGGNPAAKNPASTASGLLQFLSSWWSGRWNPFNAMVCLNHGYRAWREVGWQPWGM